MGQTTWPLTAADRVRLDKYIIDNANEYFKNNFCIFSDLAIARFHERKIISIIKQSYLDLKHYYFEIK